MPLFSEIRFILGRQFGSIFTRKREGKSFSAPTFIFLIITCANIHMRFSNGLRHEHDLTWRRNIHTCRGMSVILHRGFTYKLTTYCTSCDTVTFTAVCVATRPQRQRLYSASCHG